MAKSPPPKTSQDKPSERKKPVVKPDVIDAAAVEVPAQEAAVKDAPKQTKDPKAPAKADPKTEVSRPPVVSKTADTAKEAKPNQTENKPAKKTDDSPKSPILPLVLGGVLAGGIGFAAATFLPPLMQADAVDPVAAQQAQIQTDMGGLRETVDALAARPEAPDLTAQLQSIEAAVAKLDTVSSDLTKTMAALDARLVELEKRPLADGTVPAAYERELESLRAAIDAQKAQIETVAADAAAKIEEAKSQAAALEASAQMTAAQGVALAALGRVDAAIEAGTPFADALQDLADNSEVEVPAQLLLVAETGVTSQADLQDQFPELARAALSAARQAGVAGEGETAVSNFFKTQLGVRSLSPQEGSTPDAVLSRAEAAVKSGDLDTVLAEISALPQVSQDELTNWRSNVKTRAASLSAVADLATALTQN